jgi:3-phenylpropionate/trans-cinnamate dioxygenase ferredoxin subunit
MMRSVIVARADEIGPGERKLVQVGGRSLGVFNVGGEYYAVRNRCPHQGGPLCEGLQFAPLRSGGPGEYTRGSDGEIIRCPWHGWEFSVRTGRSWFDPERTRVRSYRAAVRSGAQLEPEPGRAPGSQPELQAETYPVRRDGAYVVVELDR